VSFEKGREKLFGEGNGEVTEQVYLMGKARLFGAD
jgi:hypothetical protein